ncbi:MAG TPA: MlaD family protein [Nitriliruptorales bacterium]|nr:MlaD family protein [Nitriliruptorales bacterium]
MSAVGRRIAGALAVVATVVAAVALTRVVGAPPSGSYRITVELGSHAGKGLDPGSDVKVRGVLVGTVNEVRLDEDADAVATLTIFPEHVLPREMDVAVTSKTFLGEKQVELRPRPASLSTPPHLAEEDVLTVPPEEGPTEVQELLAALEPVLDAVDPVELAQVVDALGSFDLRDAQTAGRNIDVTADLLGFAADTAPQQLDRISGLATLTGELATTAADVNRLNRSLPTWASLLPDRQQDVRANLEALAAFSQVLSDFLGVEEDPIAQVLRVTTLVNGVVAGQADDLGDAIFGLYRYAFKLGFHGGSLTDGTEHGWFTVFSGGEGELQRLCGSLPAPLQQEAPLCVAGADPGEDNQPAEPDSGSTATETVP